MAPRARDPRLIRGGDRARGPPDHRRHGRGRDRGGRVRGDLAVTDGGGCGSWRPDERGREAERGAGRAADRARARSSRPGFIDLHSHSRAHDPGRPRHEPKVRQGVTTEVIGVDGNAYAPFPDREDLLGFVHSTPASTARPDASRLRLGLGRRATSPGSTARSASTSRYLVGNSPLRIAAARLGRRARRRRSATTMRGDAARGDGGGRVRASAPGSTTRPAPTRRPPSSPSSPARPAAARRHLPHPRALRARRPVPRPVPGGDRDRPAGRGAGPHHPLLPPRDLPGHARPDARARRRRPRRGPGRHVRPLSVRVGEHPAPHPHADLGPGRRPGPTKERLADPAVRDAHPRRARGARHAVRRPRPAPTSASGYFALPSTALGRLDPRRGPGRDRRRRRSTSCATC